MKKKVLAAILTAVMVAVQPVTILAAPSPNTSSDGQSLNQNGAGSKTENVNAAFAVGTAETAGLPDAVVSSINNINTGTSLADAVGNPELAGYAALTKTAAVVVESTVTKAVANQEVTVTLYVPNLVDGLQNVKILYYENATGLWKVVNPDAIDFNNKTITFNMFGSGTVTVIHG